MSRPWLVGAFVVGMQGVTASLGAQPRFAGTVTDNAGRPIAGAALWLGDGRQRTTTAPDGSFRFATSQPGAYRVRVQRYGYAALDARVVVDMATPAASFSLTRLRLPEPDPKRATVRARPQTEREFDAAQLSALSDFSVSALLDRDFPAANRDADVVTRQVVSEVIPPFPHNLQEPGTEYLLFPARYEVTTVVQPTRRRQPEQCATYLNDVCVHDDVRAHIAPGDLERLRVISRASEGWSVLLYSKRPSEPPVKVDGTVRDADGAPLPGTEVW